MPMDPLFTSGEKDRDAENRHRRTAWAKASQFRKHISFLNKPSRQKAIKRASMAPNDALICRAKASHGAVEPGRPSLCGFKPPRKTWYRRKI